MIRCILCLFLLAFLNCGHKGQNFVLLDWKQLSPGLSCFITKPGEGKGEGSLHIEQIGRIATENGKQEFIPATDSTSSNVQTALIRMFIENNLKQVLKKGDEGYLRINLHQMARTALTMRVYLHPNASPQQQPCLTNFLKQHRFVDSISYRSGEGELGTLDEEAKRTLQVLDSSELSGFFVVRLKPEYSESSVMEKFSKELREQNFTEIRDISYPGNDFKTLKDVFYIYKFRD